MAKDRVYIFDTTLRDGEQVPGCQLNTIEKIEVAKALEELGVDVIEAGFPISSPGDFNSVVEISKAVEKPVICALTRAVKKDIEVAAESLKFAKRPTDPYGNRNVLLPYLSQTEQQSGGDHQTGSGSGSKYAKSFVEDVEFYAEDAPDVLKISTWHRSLKP
jgi:2-isopropylmalate synthase